MSMRGKGGGTEVRGWGLGVKFTVSDIFLMSQLSVHDLISLSDSQTTMKLVRVCLSVH